MMKFWSGLILVVAYISFINCFNYENLGPDVWPKLYKECGGKTQSPIDIDTQNTLYDNNLLPFNFINYEKNVQWNVSYDGKTGASFEPISNNKMKLKINGSNFEEIFELWKFHFHWGENNYQGSEHLIDGRKYPLEMHLVHKAGNSNFAVLGFFFVLSKDNIENPGLSNMLNAISIASNQNETSTVNITLRTILPSNNQLVNYYRYLGSLTNPPCSEGIIWTVFESAIEISESQMHIFHSNQIKKNFRFVQKLNKRHVYTSIKCENQLKCNSSKNYISLLFYYFFIISYTAVFPELM